MESWKERRPVRSGSANGLRVLVDGAASGRVQRLKRATSMLTACMLADPRGRHYISARARARRHAPYKTMVAIRIVQAAKPCSAVNTVPRSELCSSA